MESERLRDYILGKAFKAVRFDSNERRLVPEYALMAYENDEIQEVAINQFGYAPEEYIRFKQAVLTSRAVNTSAESEITMREIGNGDILEIEGRDGDALRLMKLSGNDFLVLSDDSLDARPGDVASMLQFALRLDHPALMQMRRGASVIPAKDKAYGIGKVNRLRLLQSDANLFEGYLNSASEQNISQPTAAKAYANAFDLGFNGFAGPQLDAEQKGQLYELDLMNLTYRVNPLFDIHAYRPGRSALLRELSQGCIIEEEIPNFSSIANVEEGRIKLTPREGYYILSCESQASICLC